MVLLRKPIQRVFHTNAYLCFVTPGTPYHAVITTEQHVGPYNLGRRHVHRIGCAEP